MRTVALLLDPFLLGMNAPLLQGSWVETPAQGYWEAHSGTANDGRLPILLDLFLLNESATRLCASAVM